MANNNELEPDITTVAIVEATIRKLNEPGGSKAAAILNTISKDFRDYLKSGVKNGTLVQTEGNGTCRSFKLAGEPQATQPKKAPAHPPIAAMVKAAIKKLNEPNGSSLKSIKKAINDDNQVNIDKLGNFIRKYLMSAIENGTLVQTKGKGVSGLFKLADKPKKKKAAKPKKKKAVIKPEAVKVENAEAPVVVKVENAEAPVVVKVE